MVLGILKEELVPGVSVMLTFCTPLVLKSLQVGKQVVLESMC